MHPLCEADGEFIAVRGARQNNLKNIDCDIPLRQLVVVTGVSGSGKSSLVFDTLYAEGQRRYVETFSPYARQFLDRMDKPAVDRIEGIPPAIAIDQTNPVRTSRSTVGTMTEINDHLKLLFARAAQLHCRDCGRTVRRDDPDSICEDVLMRCAALADRRVVIAFPVPIPRNFRAGEVRALLAAQGYTRLHSESRHGLEVVQDRLRAEPLERSRLHESVEAALRVGNGRVNVHLDAQQVCKYSRDLHCAHCDVAYRDPTPSAFSFNSPIGACELCRGFGRTISVDYGLVIPDESKSLRGGAIRPWQTESYRECQDDLLRFAKKRGVPLDTPWSELTAKHRSWVIEGEGDWSKKVWYGVRRFFAWLETRAYKMHIRVLLSKYRAYDTCAACGGARLKSESLLWRVGPHNIHDLMLMPISQLRAWIGAVSLGGAIGDATAQLLGEIRSRLTYLADVGLDYLTLDRQSRTLSGGEVQRINLTTALGTSLVNTLFVLDEPSVGLHPRDMQRVIAVMRRLRDAGNSLVVVEHDPQIMLEADLIMDLGPGAGERGGEILAFESPARLRARRGSSTGDYLAGRRRVRLPPAASTAGAAAASALEIFGVEHHNLRGIDVRIPLRQLVCVSGVSGSGKSTLVQDVLHPALLKAKGLASEPAGRFRELRGAELLERVVMVDQSAIGRTTRSNPASYVGAFDVIRRAFAAVPAARERRLSAGTFSFNTGTGRCPSCGGNGFEHVEMQFLSDVYLRCSDCNGTRYRSETLEIEYQGRAGRKANIAAVLAMTVTEALEFFERLPELALRLQPLVDVGLDYLRLGQAVPTLSGGEAQRLKLAGHLAEEATSRSCAASNDRGTMFLFDEPTTGLHFDDVARLLGAFRKLLSGGHSVLVIEHNLDVIAASDWLIDLGPEGGAAGGQVVACGPPAALRSNPASHTGRALAAYEAGFATPAGAAVAEAPSVAPAAPRRPAAAAIVVRRAREHNLKNLDVEIPRGAFTVITGVSGSGKSTLAFDIIFNEGQRRYLESLNAYARQFVQPAARPDVDAIYGIPPTVAIEQRTSRGGVKSTVATQTEIYHFLRLLFVKLGTQYCPDCNLAIEPQSPDSICARVLTQYRGRQIRVLAPLVVARKGLYTGLAKWAQAKGYRALRVDGRDVPVKPWPRLDRFVEHDIELVVAALEVSAANETQLRSALATALEFGKGVIGVLGARGDPLLLSTKRACPSCARSFAELDPRLFSFNSKHGWCPMCFGTGLRLADFDAEQSGEEKIWNEWYGGEAQACPQCHGERLNHIAVNVRFRERSISLYTSETVAGLRGKLAALELNQRESAVGRDILAEIDTRLSFLERLGLGYLQLDRGAPTLSGGEAQRIRLAAQLGSNLRGVCYVLDEPTIGLHPRDNRVLLDALAQLAAHRNTLIVVEHDEDTIRRADHVIDLGPGAGMHGGQVVGAGPVAALIANPASVTGRALLRPPLHPSRPRRTVSADTPCLQLEGASLHNLRDIDVRIPLGRMVAVTGVSGSGKSTLARDILYEGLRHRLGGHGDYERPGLRRLHGWQQLSRVLEVDQTPIGKTPRSCPATYVGIWDEVRRIFSATPEARMRGYTASRFSFNTEGGRCESCDGQGIQTIEMSFLPDVKLLCDACGGRRFNRDTLAVRYRDRSVGDLLQLSVSDAREYFSVHARIRHALSLLEEIGLGYLTLGQQSPTLSGGEAQRLKLVTELAKIRGDATISPSARPALYVLDEPTVGLHISDVQRLILVLHRLADAGHTVVLIEHNLDVIAEADWIIDLGPEAGARGGRVVAQGPPQRLARRPRASHTCAALCAFLAQRTSRNGATNDT